MFLKLQKGDGGMVWVNPESIAFMQQIEVRGNQAITALTLTTLTSLVDQNGEHYQENTVLKVLESPDDIANRISFHGRE